MTLTEFLLARIAEDEAWTISGELCRCDEYSVECLPNCPSRVLAQCAALRKIVEQWQVGAERLDDQGRPAHLFDPAASMLLKSHAGWLRILASVYVDHPDFDPEWRP